MGRPRFRLWQLLALVALAALVFAGLMRFQQWRQSSRIPHFNGRIDASPY